MYGLLLYYKLATFIPERCIRFISVFSPTLNDQLFSI